MVPPTSIRCGEAGLMPDLERGKWACEAVEAIDLLAEAWLLVLNMLDESVNA